MAIAFKSMYKIVKFIKCHVFHHRIFEAIGILNGSIRSLQVDENL
jgi:hypothetical protein